MTLIELGKLTDLDFDQNFENWPPIDPLPPKWQFNPPMRKIFFRGTFQNFFTLQAFIGPSYNLSCWENPVYFILGASRGGQRGGQGGKKIFLAQNA
jgi:hypothetical protein